MKKNKILRAFLLILMVLTVLFIWGNSVLGREASSAQSGWVRAFLQSLVDLLGLSIEVTMHGVRKLAHFLEYFVLGTEMTLYALCGHKLDRHSIGGVLGTVFAVAFLDETIQVFSNRGPMITDVWLDFGGAVTALLLVAALQYLIDACKRKRSRR